LVADISMSIYHLINRSFYILKYQWDNVNGDGVLKLRICYIRWFTILIPKQVKFSLITDRIRKKELVDFIHAWKITAFVL